MNEHKATMPRMLIVDDELHQCTALDLLFSHMFDVTVATSVEEAKRVPLDTYDVAIIDWHLPGEDGSLLAKELNYYLPKTRILLHTADESAKGPLQDAWWYVSKSTQPEQLIKKIEWSMREEDRYKHMRGRPARSTDANALPQILTIDLDVDLERLLEGTAKLRPVPTLQFAEDLGLNRFAMAIFGWHAFSPQYRPGGMAYAREMRHFLPANRILLYTEDSRAAPYKQGNWTYVAQDKNPANLLKAIKIELTTPIQRSEDGRPL